MSDLNKSKHHDLLDMFKDTLTIYSPSITLNLKKKNIPDIYPEELQLNKANTSDKETSFSDLNIKVIIRDIHTIAYDKSNDFGFPIVNIQWLSGDVPRLSRMVLTFRSWLDLLGVVLAFWIYILNNPQITSKLLTQGYIYHRLRKTFGMFFRSYSELL